MPTRPYDRPHEEEICLEQFLPLVRSRANAFRGGGLEMEDLMQEGLLALLYARRAFREQRGTQFSTFAYVCITNRLRSAVSRAGHPPVAVSWESCPQQQAVSHDPTHDPQECLLRAEEFEQMLCHVRQRLSNFERQAFYCYLRGYSYHEMAAFLQSTPKAVDNALQRAKQKLRAS